jgi:hypothetical protein
VLFIVNELIKGEIEKPSGQYLGLIYDESLTCHGLNLNLGHFGGFTFIFVLCGESCLVVLWCAGGSAAWRAVKRIVTGVEDLVHRARDGQAQVR